MLAPEVWNFESPASVTHYKLVKNDSDIRSVVTNQYFNHFVSLTIPDALRVHPPIQNALVDDSDFYHVTSLKAHELVDPEFINLFVRNGELTLASVGTCLDEDDCVVLTPTRKLILSLRRKTYQELGIEGTPSIYSNKIADKFLVTVTLTDSSISPGKKSYERIRQRLKEAGLEFDVIFAWEPDKPEVCPSSIASYITCQGYKVKTCSVKVNQRVQYDVDVPVFDDETDGEALTEWLGAFGLNCKIPKEADGFITTFTTPEKSTHFGQVVCIEAVGLFTVKRMKRLVQEIKSYIGTMTESPWLGLHVSGLEDSVVNRGNQEHFFYSSGDYHYTVFYRNSGQSLLCVHTSSTRRPKRTTKRKRQKTRVV